MFDISRGGAGGVAHGALTGLSSDDHTQYALLAGRAGSQTLNGGTAASNNLNLRSTSHATKGSIIFGAAATSAYDEVSDRLGIGIAVPTEHIHAYKSVNASFIGVLAENPNAGASAAARVSAKNDIGDRVDIGIFGSGVGVDEAFLFTLANGLSLWTNNNKEVTITPTKALFAHAVEIDGTFDHDGTTFGVYGVTPVIRPAALTQTYATADRTHAAKVAAALTGISSSTTGTALAEPSAGYVQAEMQQNFRRIQDQLNNLITDHLDLAQFVNVIADDLQLQGIAQ